MVDLSKISDVQLDISIYNQYKIILIDKDGYILKTLFAKEDTYWTLFSQIAVQVQKIKEENDNT